MAAGAHSHLQSSGQLRLPSAAEPLLSVGPGRGALLVWAWLGMFVVWIALSLANGPRPWLAIAAAGLPMTGIYALLSLSAEYLSRLFPLRSGRFLAPLLYQFDAAIALAFFWVLLAHGLRFVLTPLGLAAPLLSETAVLFIAGVLFYLVVAAAFHTAQAISRAAEAQSQASEARLAAREAELRALRSQVNPHFLFNCLHSISALTALDPARAREMCIHLAELFRLTLQTGQRELVAVADEIAVVRAYLAVERFRFGARLCVEEAIDPATLSCAIPALLLQPLVENAIKHGIADLTRSGLLRMTAQLADGVLQLEITNDFDPESPAPERNGVGLPQVRRRLATHYGASGRLDCAADGSRFVARMQLPAISFQEG